MTSLFEIQLTMTTRRYIRVLNAQKACVIEAIIKSFDRIRVQYSKFMLVNSLQTAKNQKLLESTNFINTYHSQLQEMKQLLAVYIGCINTKYNNYISEIQSNYLKSKAFLSDLIVSIHIRYELLLQQQNHYLTKKAYFRYIAENAAKTEQTINNYIYETITKESNLVLQRSKSAESQFAALNIQNNNNSNNNNNNITRNNQIEFDVSQILSKNDISAVKNEIIARNTQLQTVNNSINNTNKTINNNNNFVDNERPQILTSTQQTRNANLNLNVPIPRNVESELQKLQNLEMPSVQNTFGFENNYKNDRQLFASNARNNAVCSGNTISTSEALLAHKSVNIKPVLDNLKRNEREKYQTLFVTTQIEPNTKLKSEKLDSQTASIAHATCKDFEYKCNNKQVNISIPKLNININANRSNNTHEIGINLNKSQNKFFTYRGLIANSSNNTKNGGKYLSQFHFEKKVKQPQKMIKIKPKHALHNNNNNAANNRLDNCDNGNGNIPAKNTRALRYVQRAEGTQISLSYKNLNLYSIIAIDPNQTDAENLNEKNNKNSKHSTTFPSNLEYKCNFCNKKLPSPTGIVSHIQTQHKTQILELKKQFGIDKNEIVSDKKLSQRYLITDDLNYKCKTCGKILHSRSGTLSHTKRHLGIRKHKCQYCGRGFVGSTACKRHEMRHTGEKNFHCDICQKPFLLKHSLKAHREIHFKGKNNNSKQH